MKLYLEPVKTLYVVCTEIIFRRFGGLKHREHGGLTKLHIPFKRRKYTRAIEAGEDACERDSRQSTNCSVIQSESSTGMKRKSLVDVSE